MTNPYYNGGSTPATGARGTSAAIRAEFTAVTAAFALLPTLSGNLGKVVRVSATGLEAYAASANGIFFNGSAGIANSASLTYSPTGNLTIAAPSSGVTITATSVGAAVALAIIGATGNPAQLSLQDGQTGTKTWTLVSGSNSNAGEFGLYNSGTTSFPVKISANNNVTIGAPVSGVALTVSGSVAVGGIISGVTDPVSAQDAATKNYVDSVGSGLVVYASVVAATTANITLSGAQTIDGVSVIAGDRVLVKNQSTGANNGIYVCAAGAWSRSTDADISAEVRTGMYVYITGGTTLGGTGWSLTTTGTITLGSTTLTFSQFGGAANITAGTGITKAGNVISITNTAVSAASYGDATSVATFTVNAQGQLTAAAAVTIALNAGTHITSGTLADARLSSNVPLKNATNTFSAAQTFAAVAASSLTLTTALAVAQGGTGATTASAARTALGVAIGTDVPSPAGSGASGTWSINVSGNAATATTATTATTANATATGNNFQMNSLGVGTAGSGTTGEIRATNNITAYYSDDRLKIRLGNIKNALAKTCALNGFYFEANRAAQKLGYTVKREVGVSAQEVHAVMPEVTAPAPIDAQYMTVRYERLVPLLIEAIKEIAVRLTVVERGLVAPL